MPKPTMKQHGTNMKPGDSIKAASLRDAARGIRHVSAPGMRVSHDGANLSIIDTNNNGGGRQRARVARWEAYEGT